MEAFTFRMPVKFAALLVTMDFGKRSIKINDDTSLAAIFKAFNAVVQLYLMKLILVKANHLLIRGIGFTTSVI